MEELTLNQTIRKIRIEQKRTQTQFYKGIFSKSVYQKIESGEKKLTIKELIIIADRLGIDLFELITLCHDETKTTIKETRKDIQNTLLMPESQTKREKIFIIHRLLLDNKKTNLEWFNLYLFFAIAFKDSVDFIFTPNEDDLLYLNKIYEDKTLFTLVDYRIYLNCLNLFGLNRSKFLENKLFPIQQKELRNNEFITTAFGAFINMITLSIYSKNYNKGFIYLKQALKFENREIDYFSKIQFMFLEQLLYCQKYKQQNNHKKEIEAYFKAYNYAELVESLGDTRQSTIMYSDLEKIKEDKELDSPEGCNFIFDKPLQQVDHVKLFLNSLPPKKIR
ncbi:helix-turn-helix domain-containing protein [Carnobacterium maltaromaticum]|uniref:helix-turn-helix domain-containing protein n=1 Tax=Carnobacterium maltaromaticum TaxID=2751 RepID=UPI00165C70DF|nr:helix-turn-helix transcriptional regulator [Carnobacterium maltaromaticum]MBC9809934.1 helix-turn-helix domain-containing protein [Carnobacterium maltaromaticum]